MDRTVELPPNTEPERTEELLSPPQIIDPATARNLAVFFSEFAARGLEHFTNAAEALVQTKKLEIGDEKNKQSIVLDQEQINELTTPPEAYHPLLEEFFDNPPHILDKLLNKLSRLRADHQGKERSVQALRTEGSLVKSVTILSNLYLILYGNKMVEDKEGIWQ